MQEQALANIKVLDLSHHIAGSYCTKLLADFGAQVIKVERPDDGDRLRWDRLIRRHDTDG